MNNTVNTKHELKRPIKLTYIFLPNEVYGAETKERIFYDGVEYETAVNTIHENPNLYKIVKVEHI